METRLTPGPVTTLSSEGRYESFACAAAHGDTVIGLWRNAKAYGHAADVDATIRARISTDGGRTWGPAFTAYDEGDPLAETSPVGIAWDEAGSAWRMLVLRKTFTAGVLTKASGYQAQILTSQDGRSWSVLRPSVVATGASWWYVSDFAIDGTRWVATGYGSLSGQDAWAPLTITSTDSGVTWSPVAAPSGRPPQITKWAEPQIAKTPDGWVMTIRSDEDWSIHVATSPDGLSWTYQGVAVREASGSPRVARAADGTLVMLFRRRPTVDDTHGAWAWATSIDGGKTWQVRDDWPVGGSMLYGGLAPLSDGSVVAVFASEDDPTRLWATCSVYATRLTVQPVPEQSTTAPVAVAPPPIPSWRYLAYRLDGQGGEILIMPDVLLDGVEFEPTLSGTPTFKASIPVEMPLYMSATEPIFVPYSTMIVAEYDGAVRGCFIVTDVDEQGPKLDLSAVGYTGAAKGTPFEGEKSFTNADATDIFRAVWANIQAQPGGDLGLKVDATTGGTRLGRLSPDAWPKVAEGSKQVALPEGTQFRYEWTRTPAKPAVTKKTTKVVNGKKQVTTTTTPAKAAVVDTLFGEATRAYPNPIPSGATVIFRDLATGTVSRDTAADGLPKGKQVLGVATRTQPKKDDEGTELKAFTLDWFTDVDLSSKIDSIVEQGGFDYWETHQWDGDGIEHRLRIAAGTAGRVRSDLRFVVGENIVETPQLQRKGDDFASEVVVLGAGEGRSMIKGTWKMGANPRIRRVKTVTDKTILTVSEANRRAEREGKIANGSVNIAQITVRDHPNAPLGSWGLGDTITIQGDGQGWGGAFAIQARILSYTMTPDKDTAVLTVTQGERGTA